MQEYLRNNDTAMQAGRGGSKSVMSHPLSNSAAGSAGETELPGVVAAKKPVVPNQKLEEQYR